jgi:penicillin-binding protein 1A
VTPQSTPSPRSAPRSANAPRSFTRRARLALGLTRTWQRYRGPCLVCLIVVTTAAATAGFRFWQIADEANRAAASFALSTGAQLTTLYDAQDRPAFTLFIEQRTDVPLDRVSPLLVAAVLTAEDRRFFRHTGFDPGRVLSAALANARAGQIVQGGSTITQQLVRLTDGERARSYRRKLREALLARAVERRFSKDAILQTYLNKVYLGEGFYGVEAAARGYFAKSASDLTADEAATIAALIQSPVRYTRDSYTARMLGRRNWILNDMFEQHLLQEPAYREALGAPLRVSPAASPAASRTMSADNRTMPAASPTMPAASRTTPAASRTTPAANAAIVPVANRANVPAASPAIVDAPAAAAATPRVAESGLYFKEAVRQQLMTLLPASKVLAGGLRVYTTIDPSMQAAAEKAVLDRLNELEKTERTENTPDPLQGSLVALDPQTGYVKALVGGRSFAESPFDRARQAHRQPGSAFKPFVFTSAIEAGLEPGTLLHDLDQPIDLGQRAEYLPRDPHGAAEMTLRDALVLSSNRAAVHLQQQVGLMSVLDYARRLGVTTPLPEVPSLALGSGDVTLMELTSAYAVFANQGVRVNPILIRRVESANGDVLFRADADRHRVIREETAFLMTSMLSDVIARGTGSGVRRGGFTQPAAGKTGTTNGFADAWFIGYTPHLAAGVWIGRDDPHEIRTRGFAAVIVVPAWTAFMKAATQGARGESFVRPPNIEPVAYCRLSGLRAGPGCNTYLDLARDEDTGMVCTLHSGHNTGTGTIVVADGNTRRAIHILPGYATRHVRPIEAGPAAAAAVISSWSTPTGQR